MTWKVVRRRAVGHVVALMLFSSVAVAQPTSPEKNASSDGAQVDPADHDARSKVPSDALGVGDEVDADVAERMDLAPRVGDGSAREKDGRAVGPDEEGDKQAREAQSPISEPAAAMSPDDVTGPADPDVGDPRDQLDEDAALARLKKKRLRRKRKRKRREPVVAKSRLAKSPLVIGGTVGIAASASILIPLMAANLFINLASLPGLGAANVVFASASPFQAIPVSVVGLCVALLSAGWVLVWMDGNILWLLPALVPSAIFVGAGLAISVVAIGFTLAFADSGASGAAPPSWHPYAVLGLFGASALVGSLAAPAFGTTMVAMGVAGVDDAAQE